jgi:hypothetical protein
LPAEKVFDSLKPALSIDTMEKSFGSSRDTNKIESVAKDDLLFKTLQPWQASYKDMFGDKLAYIGEAMRGKMNPKSPHVGALFAELIVTKTVQKLPEKESDEAEAPTITTETTIFSGLANNKPLDSFTEYRPKGKSKRYRQASEHSEHLLLTALGEHLDLQPKETTTDEGYTTSYSLQLKVSLFLQYVPCSDSSLEAHVTVLPERCESRIRKFKTDYADILDSFAIYHG